MSNIKVKAILASLVLVTALLALSVDYYGGIASAKETVPTCSVATLDGSYGNRFQFLNLNPVTSVPANIGDSTHIAGAGITIYTFDGAGNVSGPGIISFGGLVFPLDNTGTYTVNANCSGSLVFTFDPPLPDLPIEFVIVDDGNEIWTLSPTAGEIAVGIMKRQFAKATK